MYSCARACVCVCVCLYVRAWVRVHACVHARTHVKLRLRCCAFSWLGQSVICFTRNYGNDVTPFPPTSVCERRTVYQTPFGLTRTTFTFELSLLGTPAVTQNVVSSCFICHGRFCKSIRHDKTSSEIFMILRKLLKPVLNKH